VSLLLVDPIENEHFASLLVGYLAHRGVCVLVGEVVRRWRYLKSFFELFISQLSRQTIVNAVPHEFLNEHFVVVIIWLGIFDVIDELFVHGRRRLAMRHKLVLALGEDLGRASEHLLACFLLRKRVQSIDLLCFRCESFVCCEGHSRY